MTDYSRLTENTRRTVSKAFALAKERRYPEISPHVMLVALCEEGSDMVSYIFQRFGVDARSFVATVSTFLPPVGAEEPSEIPLSREPRPASVITDSV